MKYDELINNLKELSLPNTGFNMIKVDNFYWGRGTKGEYIFGFDSKNKSITPMNQSTKHLILYLNEKFRISILDTITDKNLSLLILKSNDEKLVELFVQLSHIFSNDYDESKLLKHFLSLKDLFANDKKASYEELQGMYGELFVMYSLKINYGFDISNYYQRVDKNKFDFSISQKKKFDIKSTIKPVRIHHFLHEQLDVERYNISIVSLMLQKDDCGMSLLELIRECKDLFSNNLNLVLHIENMVKNIDKDVLEEIRYNYAYSKENMRFYFANSIPKINEKNIDGVFNIEYDVDFSGAQSITIGSFIDWVKSE